MQFFTSSSISGCSIPNSLKLTGRPMYLKKCFNRDMPASAISSKSSFSGTPKTRFANRAIFFGLCSAMNVIHAGTITASPAPCVTLYTALISCSRKCDAQSSSQPTPQVPLWGNCPTPHDIGACFVIVRVLLHFICFFDDSHQSPLHTAGH